MLEEYDYTTEYKAGKSNVNDSYDSHIIKKKAKKIERDA
jgi:hypothetical protein